MVMVWECFSLYWYLGLLKFSFYVASVYSMYFHFRWFFKLFSIIFCFICWFGLMLLDWVIVNFNIIFISTKTSSIYRRSEMCKTGSTLSLALFNLILCVWYFHFPICRDTPLPVSTQTGIQLSLVTLYFCRNLQFHISRFLDPRWVSSCPHSSMPIN